jgi:uncharacterized membrane protein
MKAIFLTILILSCSLVYAATLQGTIYGSTLLVEPDVLVEISSTPAQKYLAKSGKYEFTLPQGEYILTARKGFLTITEEVNILQEGTFTLDLFLLPDFTDEDELWQETDENFFTNEDVTSLSTPLTRKDLSYIVAGFVFLLAIFRIYRAHRKYGSLRIFKKRLRTERAKTIEEHKADLATEPGHLENAIAIIKKHDGRISQKQLRREMLYISEAKVSLILTELEHQNKIEKVKKGRGNVILWKK